MSVVKMTKLGCTELEISRVGLGAWVNRSRCTCEPTIASGAAASGKRCTQVSGRRQACGNFVRQPIRDSVQLSQVDSVPVRRSERNSSLGFATPSSPVSVMLKTPTS